MLNSRCLILKGFSPYTRKETMLPQEVPLKCDETYTNDFGGNNGPTEKSEDLGLELKNI